MKRRRRRRKKRTEKGLKSAFIVSASSLPRLVREQEGSGREGRVNKSSVLRLRTASSLARRPPPSNLHQSEE